MSETDNAILIRLRRKLDLLRLEAKAHQAYERKAHIDEAMALVDMMETRNEQG